jgi:hypothetical protein
MKVYLVEIGEKHEGRSVIGVTLSFEEANNIAEKEFDSWHWKNKEKLDSTSWVGGCDYISITEWEVTE